MGVCDYLLRGGAGEGDEVHKFAGEGAGSVAGEGRVQGQHLRPPLQAQRPPPRPPPATARQGQVLPQTKTQQLRMIFCFTLIK